MENLDDRPKNGIKDEHLYLGDFQVYERLPHEEKHKK